MEITLKWYYLLALAWLVYILAEIFTRKNLIKTLEGGMAKADFLLYGAKQEVLTNVSYIAVYKFSIYKAISIEGYWIYNDSKWSYYLGARKIE